MTIASIFTEFGTDLSGNNARKNLANPFKNHPQLPAAIDVLSRHEHHHLALDSDSSEKIHEAFIQAIAQQINDENVPGSLRDSQFIYFDATKFSLASQGKEKMARDFQSLVSELKNKKQRIIFAVNQRDFIFNDNTDSTSDYLCQTIKQLLLDNNWRIIIFISHHSILKKSNTDAFFSVLKLDEPDNPTVLALLKLHRHALENFHRVTITDEIVTSALSMAAHYLPGQSIFEKTLELLDSASARASMLDRHAHAEQKSIVTPHFLTQAISNKTQIPVTHLQSSTFQAGKFVENLKKNIFGQDAAINNIASLLQNACLKLQDDSGPLCSFLLVGPQDAGKTEIAHAMAEHLFGDHHALIQANLNTTSIFPQHEENHWLLKIQRTPYAIVLIEDIDLIPEKTLSSIQDIFAQGYLLDDRNQKYDFSHAIIIATTRIASDSINDSPQSGSSPANNKTLDLMQLVMNENVLDPFQNNTTGHSPSELHEKIMPGLVNHFSQKLLQHFNIIPFVSPDYAALEKIVRAKIKLLARRLHNSFGIELTFAPEVIKFLAHEALWRKSHIKSLDKLLEQHLHSMVTHEILAHAEDHELSKRLLIQLNESGQLLRCEFITAHEAAFYNL